MNQTPTPTPNAAPGRVPIPDDILNAFLDPTVFIDQTMHETKVSLVAVAATLATPHGRDLLAALRDLTTTRSLLSSQFWMHAALEHLYTITKSLDPGETTRRAAQGILNFITSHSRGTNPNPPSDQPPGTPPSPPPGYKRPPRAPKGPSQPSSPSPTPPSSSSDSPTPLPSTPSSTPPPPSSPAPTTPPPPSHAPSPMPPRSDASRRSRCAEIPQPTHQPPPLKTTGTLRLLVRPSLRGSAAFAAVGGTPARVSHSEGVRKCRTAMAAKAERTLATTTAGTSPTSQRRARPTVRAPQADRLVMAAATTRPRSNHFIQPAQSPRLPAGVFAARRSLTRARKSRRPDP